MGFVGGDGHGLWHAPVPGVWHPQAAGLYRAIFRRRVDPTDDHDGRAAALVPLECTELSGRGGAVGHWRPDVRLFRATREDQRRRVRGLLHLAELPGGRVRQGLQALSQRASATPAEALAE